MASIYKYKKIKASNPNEPTLIFKNDDENTVTELGHINGWEYVSIPDITTIPAQHVEIEWQQPTLTPELIKKIKLKCRPLILIQERFQKKIRERYTQDDESFLTRISIGALTQRYTLEAGESDEIDAYGVYVESARAEARAERVKLGF